MTSLNMASSIDDHASVLMPLSLLSLQWCKCVCAKREEDTHDRTAAVDKDDGTHHTANGEQNTPNTTLNKTATWGKQHDRTIEHRSSKA